MNNILLRKLLRYAKGNKGQFLAVAAVVMIGITVYIAMGTSYFNLSRTQQEYYRKNNFADYYFQVVKAPEGITRQIIEVPGVKRVTGRIQMDLPLIKDNNERATVRAVTYSQPMDNELNRLTLLQGRMFSLSGAESGTEVLLDPQFAAAHHLKPGDTAAVLINNRKTFFRVIGSATSPEFIYPMKDSSALMPDPENFGIFMLENRQAQQILNMSGQINQVLVEFNPGADQERAISAIKDILKPYGNLAAYPRRDQLSHAVLQSELDGLKSVSTVLPVMFLAIAAAIQFVIQRRMVRIQRTQIGVMKALGYGNRQIIRHYMAYGVMVALAGSVAGIILGLLLSGLISQTYTQYFNLPGGLQGFNSQAVINGLLLSLGVGIIAGWTSSRSILVLSPAEAMRPEPPKSGGKSMVEYCPHLWQKLSSEWKMSLRSISRNRGRFMLTLTGVVFAVGLLVMAFFTKDAVDYMMHKYFFEQQQYDFLVRFEIPIQGNELYNISRIDGVRTVEPLMELPVKLSHRGKSKDDVLLAYLPDTGMNELTGVNDQPLKIPEDGIILNEKNAQKLGVKIGDEIEVKTLLTIGPAHQARLKVVGINRQFIGSGCYTSISNANRLLQEGNAVTAAMITVYPGQSGKVEAEINRMLGVSSVQSRDKELANFKKNLGSTIFAVSIMIFFAVILGIAIVFNASVISFSERQREIATLRVMGFTDREVSGLLLKENLIQSLSGVLLGLPFGRLIIAAYVKSVSTDLYSLPVVVYPLTYALSALGGIVFIMLAHQLAVRGLEKLNPVEILKNVD